MRVPEGKRHAVYLLHLVRLRVAALLVGEHGIHLVCAEIQRYAVLFVLGVDLLDLFALTGGAFRERIRIIAVGERKAADALGESKFYSRLLHVLLRLRKAHALICPRMARDAAEAACGERARDGDSGDRRENGDTLAPAMARLYLCAPQRKVNARFHRVRRVQVICALMQHILHLFVKFRLIHVMRPPLVCFPGRSAPAADDGGRKTGGS